MTGATAAGHRGSAAATSKKLWQTAGFSITLLMFNVLFVVIVQCPSLRNGGLCDDETPRCSRSGVFVVSSSAHASSHCGESSSLRTPLDQNAALLQCASDFTLSSLSDNEWPILRRVPGLGSKPLLAAELGEARGLECHPLQRPGGAVAGVRHRAALHRGAHAWRVGHSGFHLPRNPLTRIAKGQEAKNPPGLLRSDRQTTKQSPGFCTLALVGHLCSDVDQHRQLQAT